MQQRGMRQMSCDSEARRVTAVYRVLDMRRSIWPLRSMKDSCCDVYFAKDRCWKELDVILSSGVFFVAAKPSKLSSRKRSVLELNSMSPAEVERAGPTIGQEPYRAEPSLDPSTDQSSRAEPERFPSRALESERSQDLEGGALPLPRVLQILS